MRRAVPNPSAPAAGMRRTVAGTFLSVLVGTLTSALPPDNQSEWQRSGQPAHARATTSMAKSRAPLSDVTSISARVEACMAAVNGFLGAGVSLSRLQPSSGCRMATAWCLFSVETAVAAEREPRATTSPTHSATTAVSYKGVGHAPPRVRLCVELGVGTPRSVAAPPRRRLHV